MFRVVESFSDRADSFHIYQPGDTFPRAGVEVDDARLAELSGSGNRLGHPLIERAEVEKPIRKRAKKDD